MAAKKKFAGNADYVGIEVSVAGQRDKQTRYFRAFRESEIPNFTAEDMNDSSEVVKNEVEDDERTTYVGRGGHLIDIKTHRFAPKTHAKANLTLGD
jgi:hypothetical protein